MHRGCPLSFLFWAKNESKNFKLLLCSIHKGSVSWDFWPVFPYNLHSINLWSVPKYNYLQLHDKFEQIHYRNFQIKRLSSECFLAVINTSFVVTKRLQSGRHLKNSLVCERSDYVKNEGSSYMYREGSQHNTTHWETQFLESAIVNSHLRNIHLKVFGLDETSCWSCAQIVLLVQNGEEEGADGQYKVSWESNYLSDQFKLLPHKGKQHFPRL